MTHLYHGSTTQNLKTLEPRKRYVPAGKIDYEAIYATPLPAYAAVHSFPWSSEEGIGLEIKDEKVILDIPEKLKNRLNVPISIYKVSAEGFEHTKEEEMGLTWHTIKSVKVLKEEKYESVESAIYELGGEIEFI